MPSQATSAILTSVGKSGGDLPEVGESCTYIQMNTQLEAHHALTLTNTTYAYKDRNLYPSIRQTPQQNLAAEQQFH